MLFWKRLNKLEQIITVLVGVTTLTSTVAARIHYVQRMHATALVSQSQPMRPLTLVVRNDLSGKPVSKAKVSVIVDAAVPLIRETDSEGILSVSIPAVTREAHVTVSATGYVIYDREIPLWSGNFEDVRLVPIARHIAPQGRQNSPANNTASSPVLAGSSSPQVISAPGGIAIGGGTVTNPQVNNIYGVPAPPPRGYWTTRTVEPFTERVQQEPGKFVNVRHPRAEMNLTLEGPFIHPILVVKCSVPCTEGGFAVENPRINQVESQLSGYGDVLKSVVKDPTASQQAALSLTPLCPKMKVT